MAIDDIVRMSQATGVGGLKSFNNFNTDYGDFGAYQRIATKLMDGTTSDINFTNIPQIYQDLFIVVYGRSDYAANDVLIQSYINGDFTSTIYSQTRLEGDGASAYSTRTANTGAVACGYIPAGSSTAGIFGSITYHILNYTNTSTYKTTLTRAASDRNGAGRTSLYVNTYRSTAAITSVGVATYGIGNYVSGSRVSLYGIRAGNS